MVAADALTVRSETLMFACLAPMAALFTVAGRLALTHVDRQRKALLAFMIVGPVLTVGVISIAVVAPWLDIASGEIALGIVSMNVVALLLASYISLRK